MAAVPLAAVPRSLGLNMLQGGAEVREGDECRKRIK